MHTPTSVASHGKTGHLVAGQGWDHAFHYLLFNSPIASSVSHDRAGVGSRCLSLAFCVCSSMSSVESSSEHHTKLLQPSWWPWLLTSPLESSLPIILASAGQAVSNQSPTSSVPAHSTTFSSSLLCHLFLYPLPQPLLQTSLQQTPVMPKNSTDAEHGHCHIACLFWIPEQFHMPYVDQKYPHCVVKTHRVLSLQKIQTSVSLTPIAAPGEGNSSDVS